MSKYRVSNRHTMGQDWGGRRALNPPNVPRVSYRDVLAYAESHNMEVKREGYIWASGMWSGRIKGSSIWRTIGQTNYLALTHMQDICEGDGYFRDIYEKDLLQK